MGPEENILRQLYFLDGDGKWHKIENVGYFDETISDEPISESTKSRLWNLDDGYTWTLKYPDVRLERLLGPSNNWLKLHHCPMVRHYKKKGKRK